MTSSSDYCIQCEKPVRERQQGIQCDGCFRWNHRTCNTGKWQLHLLHKLRKEMANGITGMVFHWNTLENYILTTVKVDYHCRVIFTEYHFYVRTHVKITRQWKSTIEITSWKMRAYYFYSQNDFFITVISVDKSQYLWNKALYYILCVDISVIDFQCAWRQNWREELLCSFINAFLYFNLVAWWFF